MPGASSPWTWSTVARVELKTAMSKTRAPEIEQHRAWLGLVQPVGLVVSPPALVRAGAVLERDVIERQQILRLLVQRTPERSGDGDGVSLDDFPAFAGRVLGWLSEDLAGAPGGPPLPGGLEVPLPDYGETLRPTYAVLDPGAAPGARAYLLLVQEWPAGTDLDAPAGPAHGWRASPQARLERLLRATGVAAGLLVTGSALRLVYAPRGETSGHVTFPVPALCEVAGRPMLAALHMLLGEHRLFRARDGRRLHDVLSASRKYQSEVSTRLAEQALGALWELLRGFQAADEARAGRLLGQLSAEQPEHVYGGLLTTLLRLVFLLYAEDHGLMSESEVYLDSYSVTALHQRLREDAGRDPDTMDQRHGAWAWLLRLFRLVYDGGGCAGFELPTRHGQLFDPDEYAFLEGRPPGVRRVLDDTIDPPRVPDGCIFRVLQALLVLDGERLSYRSRDVEQIGSVYEAMMGFAVERAAGRCIGVKSSAHKPGAVRADPIIDIDALLAEKPGQRSARLDREAGCKLTGKGATALAGATTPEDIVAALGGKVSERTPQIIAPGGLYLQPGEERRRSGSHYTPRDLTGPIVRTTLAPVLAALGERPTPAQILDLAVCDPAMGSGAFLVEACRQLAEALVAAWERHACVPAIPPDEDPLLYARRLVAQRCLYGVDRNPFAVSLARLSLWLLTLARNHAFTFLDHALEHGDSLVGLTRAQIGAFRWQEARVSDLPMFETVHASVSEARGHRDHLRSLDDEHDAEKRLAWREAEKALHDARLAGDLTITAFFDETSDKARETRRRALENQFVDWRAGDDDGHELRALAEALREREPPVVPFHWEIEFPEVFGRDNPGFDAIVGNPPFAGKNAIIAGNASAYLDWLKSLHPESHGNADLVAHFFRRAFGLLRAGGAFGLIATNTIGQGDTRSTGLRWICTHGGTIFEATKRLTWPGMAAVVVSVTHVRNGPQSGPFRLEGREVPVITAFLFHAGRHVDPAILRANADQSFQGSIVLGMGFTFDDTDKKGEASPLSEMHRLIANEPRNAERISPYLGGEELNDSPVQSHHRYVIDFGEMTEAEARQWPDLMAIVERKVKPERMKLGDNADARRRKQRWWLWGRYTPALYRTIHGMDRVLANSQVSARMVFAFQPTDRVFAHTLNLFAFDRYAGFCILQSHPHEVWARFFGSSMKDDLRYTPSDCFETFPFPPDWQASPALEATGQAYYEHRAALMARNDQGLTRTYNRFHDPEERDPDILRLRDLHLAMDRAVLDAYGWTDIPTECTFLLDYDIDEETWGTKKKPYRYRWPEDVHHEVLARLLALNHARAEAERLAGGATAPDAPAPGQPRNPAPAGKQRKQPAPDQPASRPARKNATRRPRPAQPDLFPPPDPTDD
jgi:hypothetical protein